MCLLNLLLNQFIVKIYLCGLFSSIQTIIILSLLKATPDYDSRISYDDHILKILRLAVPFVLNQKVVISVAIKVQTLGELRMRDTANRWAGLLYAFTRGLPS